MTYELAFREAALKEWHKLDRFVREQFKAKLAQRLNNPRVPASKLHGHPDRYKIKLRSVGYRLVYEVVEAELVVIVVAVGGEIKTQSMRRRVSGNAQGDALGKRRDSEENDQEIGSRGSTPESSKIPAY